MDLAPGLVSALLWLVLAGWLEVLRWARELAVWPALGESGWLSVQLWLGFSP